MVLEGINTMYAVWFLLYLLVVLGIGLWGWRQIDEQMDFSTAGQNLGFGLCLGSMFASFMSALTVIGGVGYASDFGWAYITLYTVGAMAGMAFLAVTAKKWHRVGVNSLSELMAIRFDSAHVQALIAAVIVFAYAGTLVAQLFGIGWIVEGIIGVPMWLGILSVGLFFVVYTILGGMVSVARTDLIQAVVMGLGTLLMFGGLAWRLWNDPANGFFDSPAPMTIYAGETSTNVGLMAMFLVFGLGIAIHPYYVQRVLSAKDVATARMVPAVNSLLIILFYLLITAIGIMGAIYLPDQTGDAMAPAIITDVLGGVIGAVAMMAILAGVQSTTDSLLHIVGVYTSNDIYGALVNPDASDAELLRWSRISTGVFGVVVVGIATYQALLGELALIALIGAWAWGILGGSLFVTVIAGMYWKRATTTGAFLSVAGGFVFGVVGSELNSMGILPFDGIFLAVVVAAIGMYVGSVLTEPMDEEHLEPLFDDVRRPSPTSDD